MRTPLALSKAVEMVVIIQCLLILVVQFFQTLRELPIDWTLSIESSLRCHAHPDLVLDLR
jgi:hypothetical protein